MNNETEDVEEIACVSLAYREVGQKKPAPQKPQFFRWNF